LEKFDRNESFYERTGTEIRVSLRTGKETSVYRTDTEIRVSLGELLPK